MAHLNARLVEYERPTADDAPRKGIIDMRSYWVPHTSHDPAANRSVELYLPGSDRPFYRSAPHPGSPEEQVRAAVKHYIAAGVYFHIPCSQTQEALRSCALAQRPLDTYRSNLDSMFSVDAGDEGSAERFGITLLPPKPQV